VPTFYELRVDSDPEPYADGAAVVVFVSMNTQKPAQIPDGIRNRLESIDR
jgi:acyl-CoA thioesterase FadM